MSENTSIQWTDRTWNPVRGCSRVSAGCDNCYAMRQAHRFNTPSERSPYHGLTTIRRGKVDWAGVARFIPDQLGAPLKWRKPARVFVNSMSDLFHPSLSNEEIAAVFGVMAACPQHTFQVLTKQPKRAAEWFAWYEGDSGTGASPYAAVMQAVQTVPGTADSSREWYEVGKDRHWPLPNVHLGVSVENQKTADERIPPLLGLPAAVRFVSAEPLLEPVSISDIYHEGAILKPLCGLRWISTGKGIQLSPKSRGPQLDWVIVGGESGNGARPFNLDWASVLVDQCARADVACFVKQLGSRPCITEFAWRNMSHGMMSLLSPRSEHPMVKAAGLVQLAMADRSGGNMSEWPEALRVRQFPEAR